MSKSQAIETDWDKVIDRTTAINRVLSKDSAGSCVNMKDPDLEVGCALLYLRFWGGGEKELARATQKRVLEALGPDPNDSEVLLFDEGKTTTVEVPEIEFEAMHARYGEKEVTMCSPVLGMLGPTENLAGLCQPVQQHHGR